MSPVTLRNWMRFGLKGRKLGHVRKGSRIYLSAAMVKRFMRQSLPCWMVR